MGRKKKNGKAHAKRKVTARTSVERRWGGGEEGKEAGEGGPR